MTKVIIYKSKNQFSGFKCLGHAGYSEYSRDIVCASVSVLVINTLNSIEQFTGDKFSVNMDEKSGLIECSFSDNISPDTVLLMNAMILGLTEIKKQYGKTYIDLKFEEV